MSKVHSRKVGEAFRAGEAAQSNGAMRTRRRADPSGTLTIGYSYGEPVAITDGADVLRTVVHWSTTTAKHAGMFYVPGGEVFPATTSIMRRVAEGDMSWREAVRLSRAALAVDADRKASAGVPVERWEDGYRPRWEYRTEDAFLVQVRPGGSARVAGEMVPVGRWLLRVNEETTVHRTLKAARVAAWRRLGLTPMGEWRDVSEADFPD